MEKQLLILVLFVLLLAGCERKEHTKSSDNQGMSTYLDSLPHSNRYEFIKNESIAGNLAVFEQYESKDSRKLIFVCGGVSAFSVNAFWDLDINSQNEAERFAAENCDQSAVLLGYKTEEEYRF
jgi:hypothetical protein